jgi:hypothetical protein
MTPPPSPLQPGRGAQPAKKSNVLLWILIGVGGFFALLVVVVVAGGLFLAHKVRQGNFEMKSADGSVQIGGAAKLPTWVPDYPGSNPQNSFTAQGKDGRSGTFTYKTKDSVDHVGKYYRDQLEGSGFKIVSVHNSGSNQVITAQDSVKLHTIVVVAAVEDNATTVSVTYSSK